jgi:hypothetical protein
MQNKDNASKRDLLQFDCLECSAPVCFSVFKIDDSDGQICCSKCHKKYLFSDDVLRRQLRKFEALCRQILESEEILSHTAVGIDIGEHHVKIPFKLLITRFNSKLDLMIGNQPLSIQFRIEPLTDLPPSA